MVTKIIIFLIIWASLILLSGSLTILSFLFQNKIWIVEWDLCSTVSSFSLVFFFDFFSFFFSAVVLGISSCIFLFGQYYIDGDIKQKGFCILLLGFVMSILLLIFSPNIFSLILGWDGLGLSSYLLIIYYIGFARSIAGILTFLINRLGDMFFLITLCFMFFSFGWNFFLFNSQEKHFFLCCCLILTALTKRAQVPFSSWLPAAIIAPTPVSALVHSSTLVTAGIFLLLRFNNVCICMRSMLLVISLLTMLLAGVSATFEWDIKKTIAFSTLSQLGFMVFSLSQGLFFFCFFHLLCHALFKAALFLISGVLIHNLDRFQDYRRSYRFSLFTSSLTVGIVVCILCLCGFPFLSGFFSKDFILDSVLLSFWFFFIFIFCVLFTVLYCLRFGVYVLKFVLTKRSRIIKVYERVYVLYLRIWLLVITGVVLGFYWLEMIRYYAILFVFFNRLWKSVYVFLFIFSIIMFFVFFTSWERKLNFKSYFFSKIFFLSIIFTSTVLFGRGYLWVSFLDKSRSQGWLEKVGPRGIYGTISSSSVMVLKAENFIFFCFLFRFLLLFIILFWFYSLKKSLALKELFYTLYWNHILKEAYCYNEIIVFFLNY